MGDARQKQDGNRQQATDSGHWDWRRGSAGQESSCAVVHVHDRQGQLVRLGGVGNCADGADLRPRTL